MNTPLQKLSLILPLNGGVLAAFIYCGASSDVLWNILPGFLCLVSIIHGNGPVWFDLESKKSSFSWILIVFGALYCLQLCLRWKCHFSWMSLVVGGPFYGRRCRYVPLTGHCEKGLQLMRMHLIPSHVSLCLILCVQHSLFL